MTVADKFKLDGYKVKILFDNDPMNPRTEWDNITHFLFKHRRYILGDEDAEEFLYKAIREGWWKLTNDEMDQVDYGRDNEPFLIDLMRKYNLGYAKEVRMYEHGGITISTSTSGQYSDPWDSGLLGWAFMTRAEILDNWGGKYLTTKVKAKADLAIESDIEVYDDYLTGAVFGYQIKRKGEEIDSSWGYYGYDHEKSGLMWNVREAIEWDKRRRAQQESESERTTD